MLRLESITHTGYLLSVSTLELGYMAGGAEHADPLWDVVTPTANGVQFTHSSHQNHHNTVIPLAMYLVRHIY